METATLNDRDLMQLALSLEDPWTVSSVEFNKPEGRLDLTVAFPKGSRFPCPDCGMLDQGVYDTTEREWRHLDFFQHQAYLHAKVPRISCTKCGVKTVSVPWARPKSGFTLLFEALVLQLAQHMAIEPLAAIVHAHSDSIWRILDHYVEKARQAQDLTEVSTLGIDETSRRKGHQYVTTFCDLEGRRVLFVTKGKDSETVKTFVEDFEARRADPKQITEVCSDMSAAFIKGIADNLPEAEHTFDRFHVMALVNDAVDEVRRKEAKQTKLKDILKNSRYVFLKNEENLTVKQTAKLESLRDLDIKTVRAYHIKVALQRLWEYKRLGFAEAYLKKWYFWATHSRIGPIKEVAKTIKKHWDGILRFIKSRVTNGVTEGINCKIKEAAKRAYGFKTFERYRTIIYLVAGRLSLPTPC